MLASGIKSSTVCFIPTPLWKIRNGWILVIDSHIVEGIRPVKNDEREESTTFQAVFISSSGTVVSCETDQ